MNVLVERATERDLLKQESWACSEPFAWAEMLAAVNLSLYGRSASSFARRRSSQHRARISITDYVPEPLIVADDIPIVTPIRLNSPALVNVYRQDQRRSGQWMHGS